MSARSWEHLAVLAAALGGAGLIAAKWLVPSIASYDGIFTALLAGGVVVWVLAHFVF